MSQNKNLIFKKGDKAPTDYFTGTARFKLRVPNNPMLNTQIGNVVFEKVRETIGTLTPVDKC